MGCPMGQLFLIAFYSCKIKKTLYSASKGFSAGP